MKVRTLSCPIAEHVRDLVHGIQLAAKLDQVDAEPFVSGLTSTEP